MQHFVYFVKKEWNRPHHLFVKTLPCFFASGPNGMLLGTNLFSKICGLSKRLHFKDKADYIGLQPQIGKENNVIWNNNYKNDT